MLITLGCGGTKEVKNPSQPLSGNNGEAMEKNVKGEVKDIVENDNAPDNINAEVLIKIEKRKKDLINNPYPQPEIQIPIAKRKDIGYDALISFPDAEDTSFHSIMEYLPINIPNNAKVNNFQSKTFFSFDISKLSSKDRNWLLRDVDFILIIQKRNK